ncbi:hypothetical protein R0J90_13955, partial [Micrococcus sp. SIMBA_144]
AEADNPAKVFALALSPLPSGRPSKGTGEGHPGTLNKRMLGTSASSNTFSASIMEDWGIHSHPLTACSILDWPEANQISPIRTSVN